MRYCEINVVIDVTLGDLRKYVALGRKKNTLKLMEIKLG